MRKALITAVLFGALAALLSGCGEDDFQAGNRLKILEVADSGGSTAPVFFAVEETDDSGLDGDPGTNDEGENDGFPDTPETLLTPLSPDLGVITLENEPRLGVDPGVDLQVYLVDVTYTDANGQSQAFAPRNRQRFSLTIPSENTGELEIILVTEEMKKSEGGLRDIFLFGSDAERAAVRTMTAFIDVFARDIRNNDTVHVQGSVGLTFINPLSSQVPQ